jgi:hypothetical protein
VHGAALDSLEVRNTGDPSLPLRVALHTYHLVDDLEAVRISGVQAERPGHHRQARPGVRAALRRARSAFDNGATLNTAAASRAALRMRWCGIRDAADAAALVDMADEEYLRFVCIEPARIDQQPLDAGAGVDRHPPHHGRLIRLVRLLDHPPAVGWIGRAFSGYRRLNSAICAGDACTGCFITSHSTPSVHGGVVSEPM